MYIPLHVRYIKVLFKCYASRPNILLTVDQQRKAEMKDKLGWLIDKLIAEKVDCPKTIIFCRYVDIYTLVKSTIVCTLL
jgi:hypothetical protein